ncbi:MAG: PQQ-binding-like beta-propeller repeat protein, partial [Firmicutes bacterium]|nr:PQQ-binding-like beta-propeller repeat protein [Bacillota bacterium]
MRTDLHRTLTAACCLLIACLGLTGCNGTGTTSSNQATATGAAPITGKLHWRGDTQNGNSRQTGLPNKAVLEGDNANLRWTLNVPGRGTAAIAEYPDGPRLFVLGYPGEGAELTETLYCMDPETGEQYWSRSYADFISDIVYNRYTIGGPTIDPETGNVFIQMSQGLTVALDRDGNELWRVSLMETYGKL